jgi:phthiocerol/phenolphthiocerol synthesis type-I polyketide synthase C
MFNMGLDSLMGVELALAVETRFGVKLPVMSLKESPTILKLADKLCTQLTAGNTEGELIVEKQNQIDLTARQHGVEEGPELLEQIAQAIHSGESSSSNRMIH